MPAGSELFLFFIFMRHSMRILASAFPFSACLIPFPAHTWVAELSLHPLGCNPSPASVYSGHAAKARYIILQFPQALGQIAAGHGLCHSHPFEPWKHRIPARMNHLAASKPDATQHRCRQILPFVIIALYEGKINKIAFIASIIFVGLPPKNRQANHRRLTDGCPACFLGETQQSERAGRRSLHQK